VEQPGRVKFSKIEHMVVQTISRHQSEFDHPIKAVSSLFDFLLHCLLIFQSTFSSLLPFFWLLLLPAFSALHPIIFWHRLVPSGTFPLSALSIYL
jgi:hypothetical protein